MSRRDVVFLGACLAACVAGGSEPLCAQGPVLVSSSPAGAPDADSTTPILSGTGRYVLFTSAASNLVPDDSGGLADVFLRDLVLQTTERVNLGPGGVAANASSRGTALSPDARFVVFVSKATNLVPGGGPGLYVRDRLLGVTTLETLSPSGTSVGTESDDGRISDDGHWLAMASYSAQLVPGDTNGTVDVFVRDRWTGMIERVSVGPNGEQADRSSYFTTRGTFSADGRVVAFDSQATNLLAGFVPHGTPDTFVRDLETDTTIQLNATSTGVQGSGPSVFAALSADGRWAAFASASTNLVAFDPTPGYDDLFLRDLQTGALQIASLGSSGVAANSYPQDLTLSGDGRWLSWRTNASNLVEQATGAFDGLYLRDRLTQLTWLINQNAAGAPAAGLSYQNHVSRDGRAVAFTCEVQLLTEDLHSGYDTYVYDRFAATPFTLLAGGVAGAQGVPELLAEGTLSSHSPLTFGLAGAPAGGTATIVASLSLLQLPFKGGTLIPQPDVLLVVPVPLAGPLHVPVIWPDGIPAGVNLYLQAWMADGTAVSGFAASNGLLAVSH